MRYLATLMLMLGLAFATVQAESKFEQTMNNVGDSLEHAAQKTGKALDKAAHKTGKGLNTAGEKTGSWLERTGDAIRDFFSGSDKD